MASILDSVNQRTQMVGQNRLELLMFNLNGRQRFGINVFKVREVLQCPELTEVPRQTSAIKGMAHIRGETIPVLDLSEAIGRSTVPQQERNKCFLIVAEYNKRTLAFLVRQVDRILNTQWDQIMAPPKEIGNENYLTAVFEYEKKLVEILDVEQILADLYPMSTDVSDEVATHEVRERAPRLFAKVAPRQRCYLLLDVLLRPRQPDHGGVKAVPGIGALVRPDVDVEGSQGDDDLLR